MSKFSLPMLALSLTLASTSTAQIAQDSTIGRIRSVGYRSVPVAGTMHLPVLADRYTVRQAGAPWVSLAFGSVVLGAGSRLEIVSRQDGQRQIFTRDNLQERTAFFNGDAVEVRLYAAPGTRGNRFEIASVSYGTRAAIVPASICDQDDRVLSADRRVARLHVTKGNKVHLYSGFSASQWGCIVTSGSCLDGATSVTAQFEVPPSTANGDVVQAAPAKQYLWTGQRFFVNGGIGNNWGVFAAAANVSTGKFPGQSQGYVKIWWDRPATELRLFGYGAVTTPKTRNHVLQTDRGPLAPGSSGSVIRHRMDTTPGSSGSLIAALGGTVAFGIHTHDGCVPSNRTASNVGTSFHNTLLRQRHGQLCAPPQIPDLHVSAFSVSSTLLRAAARYTFRSTIGNFGLAAAKSVRAGYYLSKDQVVSSKDRLLKSFAVPALSVRGTTIDNSLITMPNSLEGGFCYPAVWVDTEASIPELSKTNNVRLGKRSTCVGLADLELQPLVPTATALWPGRKIAVRMTVRNAGQASARLFRTGLYLSTDSVVSREDLLLSSYLSSKDGLGVGRLESSVRTVRIPNEIPSGKCHLIGAADDTRVVSEIREDNNTKAHAVVCAAGPMPDLEVVDFSLSPRAIAAGDRVAVSAHVRNAGVAKSSQVSSGYYLSTDSTISKVDTLLAAYQIPSLAPNAKHVDDRKVTVPSTIRSGACWLGVFADDSGAQAELDETNNVLAHGVKCTARPDLVIDELSAGAPSSVAGSKISVDVVTANRGAAAAAATTTAILLSADAVITRTDDVLATQAIPSLDAGKAIRRVLQVSLPYCTAAGARWIGALGDAEAAIVEGDESNNALARPKNIVAYTGTERRIEWLAPRVGATNGPILSQKARFVASRGGRGDMCITAPAWAGYRYICVWSAKPSFALDDFSTLSLSLANSAFMPGWVGNVGTNGQARASFVLPRGELEGFTVMTHVLFLTPQNRFSGFSDNRLVTEIVR